MEFHNVAFEKASAMRRYRRKRKLEQALHFFNICVALLVFSRSSWFPTILHILCHLYTEFVSLFNHPFYVFLLGNAIILFIYALSDKKDGPHDVYDEFHTNNESHPTTAADSESPVSPVDPPVPAETVTAVTETTKTRTTTTTSSCTRVSRTTTGEKVSESKCYRRVQSESFSRRIVVGAGPELKRVDTEVGREVVRYGGELERRLCSVENLSKEDFNRTVEDFIAKHRRMQWEEHRESQKTE